MRSREGKTDRFSQWLPRNFCLAVASRSDPIGHGRAAAEHRCRSKVSNEGRWPFAEQAPCPAVNTAMGSAADVAVQERLQDAHRLHAW